MSEFDELVASPGVLMAGRFGADGRIAEHKTTRLYIEIRR
jgi:roadblock/LC7 domain-containing protein